MPRRTGLWIAWLAAALGCGDAAGVAERDAGAEPRGHYGRDGGSCGDGQLDRGEDCDGTVIGQSCESLGLVRGPLSCTSECTVDTSLCGTNPRPDPPFIPDGGPFFDGGPSFASEEVLLACEQIVSCRAVPLPPTDLLFEQGFPPTQQAFCEQQITAPCFSCALAEAPLDELDAGGVACESACREECWALSFPLTGRLFDPDRCAAIAADFVVGFDASCLCNACTGPLSNCLSHPLCHAALICIDETGCQGAACSSACADPIQELSADFGSFLIDELRSCIANNGCQDP